ncbi:unnamed protein product [Adineta steineri]|uniref:Uncharacterized protein n=1 Tax=Adineta steineri TaxID=433720 RepID=A0A816F2M5_9BILA|nr:unnamed protein product [Adineta steineri]CAF1657341.1 unnamed protein product [Adineta steineri]
MFYNGQPSPSNKWPSVVQYPNYQSDRPSKIHWFLILAIVLLILSVAALIIVFAVEHAWFSDSYNQTSNHYGLWRLCFYANQTCDSWFSTNGPNTYYIDQRHSRDRLGINAWQALEIVFLFLTTSTLIIALISIICYQLKKNVHYYLAILAAFSIWPAVCMGIAALFVFGFAVYNVSQAPHALDWCFYVNLVAVILSTISAILLTIYAMSLKKPIQINRNDTAIDTFADLNDYSSTLNPSTYVVVRRSKQNRKEPYDYPQVLYPQQYFPSRMLHNTINTDYITNPNHHMLTPYASLMTNQQKNPSLQQQPSMNQYRNSGLLTSPSTTSLPPQAQFYQPPISSYPYQPAHWHRTGQNYNNEPSHDYIQRGIYRPARLNQSERTYEPNDEPRVLHYYTGYDHFSALDSSDVVLARHHQSLPRSNSPVRYTVNPPYFQQDTYLKSAL